MSDLEEPKPSGISRRTVAKAMAWSVPAVALAVPAPAYAASGNPPVICVGAARKLPGNSCQGATPIPGADVTAVKGFVFPFQVTNNTSKTIIIKDVDIVTNPVQSPPFVAVASTPALPATIAPNTSVTIWVYTTGPNSGNFTVDATATVYWGHTLDDADHTPIQFTWTIDGFPPTTPGNDECTPPYTQVACA